MAYGVPRNSGRYSFERECLNKPVRASESKQMLKLEKFCKENDIAWCINMSYEGNEFVFEHGPSGKKWSHLVSAKEIDRLFTIHELEVALITCLQTQFDLKKDSDDIFKDLKIFCVARNIEFSITNNSFKPELYTLIFTKNYCGSSWSHRCIVNTLIAPSSFISVIIENLLKKEKEHEEKTMRHSNELMRQDLGIKNVIFNDPATIVLWRDGSKTVVKCQEGDIFDPEKGLAMAICKKALGTNGSQANFNDIFKKWLPEEEDTFAKFMNPPVESKVICRTYTVKDYAAANDISDKAVYKMIKEGKLDAHKNGRYWHIIEKGDLNG